MTTSTPTVKQKPKAKAPSKKAKKATSGAESGTKSKTEKMSTETETETETEPAPETELDERSNPATDVTTLDAAEPVVVLDGGGEPSYRLRRLAMAGRRGGVAPFVPPPSRLKRAVLRRRWERRGFVPLSPGRPKLRHRILPRTVIGISFMLLAFGVGAAFSGAAFYAYYDARLAESEETVARFVEGFDQQFTDATGAIDTLRNEAIGDIRGELSPLGDYVDDANGVIGLPATAGESVWLLETRDEAGKPATGAAWAVAAHSGGTAFVTSYSLIVSSVTGPSPTIELVKGDQRIPATLWAWDATYDLAIVVVDDVVAPLELATAREQVASVGARTFALSGVGGQGATASPGVLLDQSESGLQHTAPVGSLFVGGPLLNGAGKVVGVASLGYQPFGFDTGRVLQAPDVAGLCASVLLCADDDTDVTVNIATPESE